MAEAELEEATAEVLAVLGVADVDAIDLEDLGHGEADRPPLERREVVVDPVEDRLPTCLGVGVELDRVGPRRSGHVLVRMP